MKFEWKCPECGAPPHAHGKGGAKKCEYNDNGPDCEGFICECELEDALSADDPSHGLTLENPCKCANCFPLRVGWDLSCAAQGTAGLGEEGPRRGVDDA